MPKTFTSKQTIKVLKKKGFKIDHVTGSHYIFGIRKAKGELLFLITLKICPRARLIVF